MDVNYEYYKIFLLRCQTQQLYEGCTSARKQPAQYHPCNELSGTGTTLYTFLSATTGELDSHLKGNNFTAMFLPL